MTNQPLATAIENHRLEVYGDTNPDFIWDIELYQAAGLLPDDYTHPNEEDLANTNHSLVRRIKELEAARDKLAAERDEYRALIVDLRDHGVRHDLNPTMDCSNLNSLYTGYTGYIKGIDSTIRTRARRLIDRVDRQAERTNND